MRPRPKYQVDSAAPVGRLAHHADVGLVLEDHAEPRAHQALVVGYHHVDVLRDRRGLGFRRLLVGVLAPEHARGSHALGDAAQPQRTGGMDRFRHPGRGDSADHLRGEYLARRGCVAEPTGDDHRGAVEVLAFRQRLPGVEPDAQLQLPGRGRRALHAYRAADRGDSARERDHQPVAGRLDLTAPVLGDRASQRREVLASQRVGRLVALTLEQRCRSDEVGEQDRDE